MAAAKGKAPRPVKGGREEQAKTIDRAQMVIEIKIKGESFGVIRYPNVPMSEILAVRSQVGISWQEITGETGVQPGVDTYAILAWLAKRAHGFPKLTWDHFNRFHWPSGYVSLEDCESPVVDPSKPVDPEVAEESDPQS